LVEEKLGVAVPHDSHSLKFWGTLCYCERCGFWSRSVLRGLRNLRVGSPNAPFRKASLDKIAKRIEPDESRYEKAELVLS
jgi:hypothetical protein